MTQRDLRVRTEIPEHDERSSLRHRHPATAGINERRLQRVRSPEEAEERYVAARDRWTAAMRQASSGRSADLAELAIAQEAYETAIAERERWASGARIAVPVESSRPRGIEAVVGQELSWRRVHEQESDQPKGLRRLIRRITGRG